MSEAKSGQPPQEQKRQPGREHKMRPQPDYEPRYPGSGRLRNKVALVTGGDSGIGRAVSAHFAREVAPSFLFLACDDSIYFTGQVLHPNGGVILNT